MIRAPDVKICNHRRMRHRLRPSLHAQIQMLHGESRWHPWRVAQIAQKSGNIALCLPDKYPRHQRARSGSKHLQHPNPHSQKRSSRTNPAISRPSASPTPRNDPRHPNVPRGVRKTCTTHGFRAYDCGLPKQAQRGNFMFWLWQHVQGRVQVWADGPAKMRSGRGLLSWRP